MKLGLNIVLAGLILIISQAAFLVRAEAHEARPIYIELTQTGQFITVYWSTPPTLAQRLAPRISLTGCNLIKVVDSAASSANFLSYKCASVSGRILNLDFPSYNPSLSTVIKLRKDGKNQFVTLAPGVSQWVVPESTTGGEIIKDYFRIGIQHILRGIDHLLFLAGLMFIARTPVRILTTVTGFTLAHSLTIFLTAFNIIQAPIFATEIIIALSIVFLASEIARNNRQTLTWRRPIFAASIFGLFHGIGFASALGEIGLPQTDRIFALVSFNLGVEAGQILVGVALFSAARLFLVCFDQKRSDTMKPHLQTGLAYMLGIVSSAWFFERLLSAA
jgi:hydrogenase/urease accessory protein HupE